MKQIQRGFTLIELVVVIVILGILAATAIPKFVDLKSDAGAAAAAGVAGALSSASTINYAARALNRTVTPASLSGSAATLCTEASQGGLLNGGWPAGYTATTSGAASSCSGTGGVDCKITHTSSAQSANYTLTCYP